MMELFSFAKAVSREMVEVGFRLCYRKRNRVALVILDDRFGGIRWPCEVPGERKVVLEGEREGVFEFRNDGI